MTSWSRAAGALWGKTDPESGSWLPLVRHLEDSAAIGGHLFDTWLADNHRLRLDEALEGQSRSVLTFLCGVHDVGKCSPAFVIQARQRPEFGFLCSQAGDAGFTFGGIIEPRLAPHGAVGELALRTFLKSHGMAAPTAKSMSCVVGGHHGAPPTDDNLEQVAMAPGLGGREWGETRLEILRTMAEVTGFDLERAARLRPLPIWAQSLLSGVVILSDWLASNVGLFPYDTVADSTENRLAAAVERLDFPERWQPRGDLTVPDLMLQQRFPRLRGAVRPLQRAAVEASLALTSPALLIMEAPMGSGKTEAALLAAEILAIRFGSNGIFFGLPTMATTDPMFPRVRSWLERVPADGRTALNLAHSRSGLNDEFQDFLGKSRTAGVEDDGCGWAGVYADSWFSGRKRSALASHVVATIDQALFADLKAKHVTLRQLAITSKVVIIDEVHAADDFMSVYLEGLLTWLGHQHVPVILLTATLPPAQRTALAQAYASGRRGGRTAKIDLQESLHYPRLTVVSDTAHDHPVDPVPVRVVEVAVRRHADDPAAVAATLQEALADGGCAGVICNTVKRAQEMYRQLSEEGLGEVVLIHSKFVAPHRAAMERDIVRRLGPGGDRPERIIVVGTQVLEQSLDIDFDVMVTDVAPTDLLLQRLGRLHRHERGAREIERPERLRTAVCHLTGVEDWSSTPPKLVSGGSRVYGSWPLYSTLSVLDEGAIRLPDDIPRLVAEAYDEDREPPSGWAETWSRSLTSHRQTRERKRHNASAFALRRPRELSTLHGLVDVAGAPGKDAEDPKVRGRARVRDSEESVEVLVITKDDAGNAMLIDGVGPMSGRVIPSSLGYRETDLARAVASCTVSLPGAMTRTFEQLDETIEALEKATDTSAWQASPWLAGQLFLVLDESGRCEVGNTVLAYDRELGLRVVEVNE